MVPVLTDGVIRLRAPARSDLAGIVEACTDEQTQRYTSIPQPYSPELAAEYLATVIRNWSEPERLCLD